MDIGVFMDFLVLCDTKNFTRAAELRHVSQAAFSRRIQALEVWAKATLVERGTSPVRLTDAGQRLRVSAAEITAKISSARAEVSGTEALEAEHIRIGTTSLLTNLMLPEHWRTWSNGKSLSAHVKVGDVYDLVTELAAGNIDLLIVFQCPSLPLYLDRKRYEAKVLMPDVLRPMASRAWVDSGSFAWPGKESAPVPLMMWPSCDYFGRLVDKVLRDAPSRLVGNRILESSASEVIRAMTARGFCVSWLPERAIMKSGLDCVGIGSDGWSLPLEITAFRDRENDARPLLRLWDSLSESPT